jgi:hypothetical protein
MDMKKQGLAFAAALFVLGVVGPARGDAVPPEPETCPAGSTPQTCHGGPHCKPADCTTDADCSGGASCVGQALCIGEVVCAGLIPEDASIDDYKRPTVEGACPAGNECTSPATCSTRKVCVVPTSSSESTGSPPTGGGDSSGCSCELGSGAAGAVSLAGAFCAALLLAARRRRKPL